MGGRETHDTRGLEKMPGCLHRAGPGLLGALAHMGGLSDMIQLYDDEKMTDAGTRGVVVVIVAAAECGWLWLLLAWPG